MNTETFDNILESRVRSIKKVLGDKAKEYAVGDRLYNFKRASEIMRTSPQMALAGMWMKHVVSVLDLVETNLEPTPAMVEEKIGDAINYLILLEAIFAETYCYEDRITDMPPRPRGRMIKESFL